MSFAFDFDHICAMDDRVSPLKIYILIKCCDISKNNELDILTQLT